jgi:hypothetical protein
MLSERFLGLERRIAELKLHFLPPLHPLGEYTPKELDAVRAFRLLSHAEIEQFIEDSASLLGETLKYELKHPRQGNQFSRAIAASALGRLPQEISENNGVNSKHLLKLFGLFGFGSEDFDKLDSKMLSRMSAFGKNRGEVAHNAAARITVAPDPARELAFIEEILGYISLFDKEIQRRRLHGILG